MVFRFRYALMMLIAAGMITAIAAGGHGDRVLGAPGPQPPSHMGHGETGTEPGPSAPPVAGAPTISAAAVDFAFKPKEFRVKAGRPVNIALTNRGAIVHDLVIPAAGFHVAAAPGKQSVGALTVKKNGTYEFYCSVPGHREAGMRGRLIVTR